MTQAGIPKERCLKINLGYLDPAEVDPEAWQERAEPDVLVIPRAGEMLYRVGRRPDIDEEKRESR